MQFNEQDWAKCKSDPEIALDYIALLVDNSQIHQQINLAKVALRLIDELEPDISTNQQTVLFYFRANAWSAIRKIQHQENGNIWQWDQLEILQETFWLRSAIRSTGFSELDPIRQCQILVNTGNILNHIGRSVEAIELWQRALKIIPLFGMAKANLALGLENYAKLMRNEDSPILLYQAHELYTSLNTSNTFWESFGFETVIEDAFQHAALIRRHIDLPRAKEVNLTGYSLGSTQLEQDFRLWALKNCLFLNSLNDLGNLSIAAHDSIHLPGIVQPSGEAPKHIGFYNQLKQEYASARFLFWQGTEQSDDGSKHFSDQETLLIDTLDYPSYGLSIEQIKLSFRMTYSIFDKIAFFINDYWQLGVHESSVYFKTIWFDINRKKKTRVLKPPFHKYQNSALRALYWLGKDFVEGSDELKLSDTMEPDAHNLRVLRNHLEHKYCKVHDNVWQPSKSDSLHDELAFHITKNDLAQKALRMLKVARAALIYLSLAVHQEEFLRSEDIPDTDILPIELPEWS